jgi:predicted phosphodiesterase
MKYEKEIMAAQTSASVFLKGHSHEKVFEIIAANYSLGINSGPPTYFSYFFLIAEKFSYFLLAV